MDDGLVVRLTAVEAAELGGLRAYAAKGKLEPGSVGERRLLELVAREAGEVPVVVRERWTKERVQDFYGVSRRFFYDIEEIGKTMGMEVPWEEPGELVAWFEVARGKGLREKGAPPRIRAKLKGEPLVEVAGKVVEKPRVQQPDLPMVAGGESGADETIKYFRQKSHALQQREWDLRAAGDSAGAALVAAELADVLASQRQWEVSRRKIQEGDEAARREVTNTMAAFSAGLWQVLRRTFLRGCDPEEKLRREAVLNEVAEGLPGLLEEHFGIAPGGVVLDEAA